ncbi:MAG: chlorophyll a/b-binding protein [Cyanobacteriota bacterium]|nr:chlorophyll a/b-binding protein [Cyanobacteriota bacterium]
MAKPKDSTPKGFGQNVSTQKPKSAREEKTEQGGFGFTPQAETLNGRLAMLGFTAVLLIEWFTNQGVLEFLGLQ